MISKNFKNTIILFLLTANFSAFSQQVIKNKIYTINTDEKIIMDDEHVLSINQNEEHYHLLVENSEGKFLIYDDNRYGPYDEIYETWGKEYAIAEKGNKKYLLLLTLNKIFGPYRSIDKVTIEGDHYGFRFTIDSTYAPYGGFVIIDEDQYGPYSSIDLIDFSPSGDNWLVKFWEETETWDTILKKYPTDRFFRTKKGGIVNGEEISVSNYNIFVTADDFNYVRIDAELETFKPYPKRLPSYEKEVYKTISYFYKDQCDFVLNVPSPEKKDEDEISIQFTIGRSSTENNQFDDFENTSWGTVPTVSSLTSNIENYEGQEVFSFSTKKQYLTTKDGKIGNHFNELEKFGLTRPNNEPYAVVKNYSVINQGKIVPIYSNYEGVVYLSEIPVKKLPTCNILREKFLLIGNRKYGPFENYKNYSLETAMNGSFGCIVNNDNELYINGKLTGIKNVDGFWFDDKSGNYIVKTENNKVWSNGKLLGELDKSIGVRFSEDGTNHVIYYETDYDDSYSIYLSYSKQIIKVKDKLSWDNIEISSNGKHFAYNSEGIIVINNKEIDTNSFSLVYSENSNSFCWLTLNGKEVYKKEYLLKD